MNCHKIPKLIELDSYNGDYSLYENAVYNAYQTTYGSLQFSFNGLPIHQKKMPLYKGKPCTFWHIISTGNDEANRIPDLRRYERICWPGFILSHCLEYCNNLLVWETRRKSKIRTILWCKDINYVVVLDKRKDFYLFWTAYPVSYKRKEYTLQAEYNAYVNAKAAH